MTAHHHRGRVIIIIPARMESQRLPGKVLLADTGKPLVQHTYEAATRSQLADDVYIATDSDEVAAAAARFGASCLRTTTECPTGTHRVAEADRQVSPPADIIVNLQADEPCIRADDLDSLIDRIASRPRPGIATLAGPVVAWPVDRMRLPHNTVSVAVDHAGLAAYFSRSALRQSARHVGVYAFHAESLAIIRRMPLSRLATAEGLEQLQWLDHGLRVAVQHIHEVPRSINTPDDYREFVRFVKEQHA
jgi:3-deoxy-manno-octulosonate cytidylyltransferase (CMP-KDO synthetase)